MKILSLLLLFLFIKEVFYEQKNFIILSFVFLRISLLSFLKYLKKYVKDAKRNWIEKFENAFQNTHTRTCTQMHYARCKMYRNCFGKMSAR